tara:strand:+ start:99 stop:323 length:225 start_codon:yes stop_codon:yes gene_type:complete
MINLDLEQGKLSKKAQQVCRDIGRYTSYYESAKGQRPPVIRINSQQMDSIKTSLKRLKIEDEDTGFKGVPVIAA